MIQPFIEQQCTNELIINGTGNDEDNDWELDVYNGKNGERE